MALDMCGAASRFAVLKIEDDEDKEEEKEWKTSVSKKKTNKQSKQKKKQPSAPTNSDKTSNHIIGLQPVAPSSSPPLQASEPTKSLKPNTTNSKHKGKDEWKTHDDKYVAEAYLTDLQSAIVQSKEAFKTEKKLSKLREAQLSSLGSAHSTAASSEQGTTGKKSKKKKKQQQQNSAAASGGGDKKVVMSLEEFHQSNGTACRRTLALLPIDKYRC